MKGNYSKRIKNLLGASKVILNAFGFSGTSGTNIREREHIGVLGNVEYDSTGGKYFSPGPTDAQKEIEMAVTGGRGILPQTGTSYEGPSYDMDDIVLAGKSEEVKLQRALLKMDVRDGKVPQSDLSIFDFGLMGIKESSPGSGFFSYKSKDGSEFGVGCKFKF